MKDELSASMQHCIGQVRWLCYLLDEQATILIIQSDGQTITAHAAGQIAQDLRALPRGAIICVTLHVEPPDCPQVIAFSVVSDDGMNDPNTRRGNR